MKKIIEKAFKPIDQEEKDLMESIERDEPEDLCEVEYLLNPQAFTSQPRMGNSDNMTIVHENPKVGRNEPCPCLWQR